MSVISDWLARGRDAVGANDAMWAKAFDMAGDLAVNLTVAALILIGAVFVSRWAANAVHKALSKLRVTRADRTLTDFFAQVTRWVVLIIGVVAVLQRLGVQTASIIAVLGAASLAIGLAIRGTLADLAAGVMLLVLRPYRVGDQLELDGATGRVRRLDLFNTELTTPDNRKIVMPNSKALDGMIVNRNGYATRRIDLDFGIHYDTPLDKAFALMAEIARAEPLVLDEPGIWTGLTELKDSAMNVQLQAWVKPDDTFQARVNLLQAVKEAFDAAGIIFPYPHQVAVHDDSRLGKPRAVSRTGRPPRRKQAGDGARARH